MKWHAGRLAESWSGLVEFRIDRLRDNVRGAATEDLLDRVTVYRSGLEPDALPIILEELRNRGVTPEEIVAHEMAQASAIRDDAGLARMCALCRRPAVVRRWIWHRMFGRI
ncbi:MAG: hypothetical protein NZM29_01730, partial [Nitrospira sp.]|nr:hypothetical protein [Nitrospira sp.]